MFEEITHTGEVAFKIEGETLEEIVIDSIKALQHLYFQKLLNNNDGFEKEVFIQGIDFEDALISLLNEIIFLFDAKKIVIKKVIKLEIKEINSEYKISIRLTGLFDNLSYEKYTPQIYVKAVSYGQTRLKKENGKYSIILIIDI